ncbi:hypothetical protein MesoLjLa_68070 (plasmid) [Mesorhizobium sp. L-2-11]|nr:hypothetical protein MesoLjLa_68070 [Mesorhizobium sp. L-2-11]
MADTPWSATGYFQYLGVSAGQLVHTTGDGGSRPRAQLMQASRRIVRTIFSMLRISFSTGGGGREENARAGIASS